MGLRNYESEALGLASDLTDHLDFEDVERALALREVRGDAWLEDPQPDDIDLAARFMIKTFAQREVVLDRLEQDAKITLVLHARALALLGARTIRLTDNLSHIVGMSYRPAAVMAAKQALRTKLHFDADEICPSDWHD